MQSDFDPPPVPTPGDPGHRPRSRVRALRQLAVKASGAVSGQLSQALGSFLIQALAARALGAAGLGMFALMYGAIVLGTAISSGLIGDSLTVLARANRDTRAALQNWCVIVSGAAGVIAGVISFVTGAVTLGDAMLFGALTTVFIVEDALRRALMAILQFWRLPVVDLVSLALSLAYLIGAEASGVRLTLGQFLFALLIGQFAAALVAIPLLPAHERPIRTLRSTEMKVVFNFGIWRAAQQSVRPGLLTLARVTITVIAGVAAYGRLEAARVYMAPALLVVTGMGSMMLPMWVKHRADGVKALLRRADRAAQGLFALTLVLGALGTLLLPYLGGVLTDGKYVIAPAAVFGWAVYAAATAAVTPFGTLAALQGKQARVMVLRLVEPLVALSLLLVFLLALGLGTAWSPYALSVGAVLSGLCVRYVILVPMARGETTEVQRSPGRHRSTSSPHAFTDHRRQSTGNGVHLEPTAITAPALGRTG